MESEGFAVRELRAGDAAALVRLHVASWQDTATEGSEAEGATAALDPARIIGFAVSAEAAEDSALRPRELNMLYVEQASHGSGAGQALLDAVLPRRPAFLWVARDNPRARAFYRRNGFQADGTELIDIPVPRLTSVRMVR